MLGRAARALRRALLDGARGARAAWPRRVADRRAAARSGGVLREHRGRRGGRATRRSACRAGHSLRHRLVARGPSARGAGRRQHRPRAHEQGADGAARGPDGHGAGRRHAHAAQQRDPPHGALLPDRSGRRCEPRRHERDARERHERGALRDDARERARADRRHAAGRGDSHRHARAQVVRRLRPDAPDGRQRRHARRDDRDHAAPLSAAGSDLGRDLHLSEHRCGRAHDDPDHPDGHSDRALRTARRACGPRRQPARQAHARRSADAADGVPRQRCRREGTGRDGAGHRGRSWRRALRMGDDAPRNARACGRRVTTPTSPACR